MNNNYPVIVIGGSAGAIEALKVIMRDLPPTLPAAVFVVVHLYAQSKGLLPGILMNSGPLPAVHPADGQVYQPGHIYVAPPDQHLLIENGYIRLSRGAKENRHRPAIDPLFRSAARYRGDQVIAVLLTGMLDDGTAGLMAVRMREGRIIVQSPADASFPDMPQNAIDHVEVDYILPVEDIAGQLVRMMPTPEPQPENDPPQTGNPAVVTEKIKTGEVDMDGILGDTGGNLIPLVCPDCGGALWELDEGGILRYHCHVGHAFNAKHLFEAQTEVVEEALWTAVRALKERAALATRFSERLRERGGDEQMAQEYDAQAAHAERQIHVIRKNLLDAIIGSSSAD